MIDDDRPEWQRDALCNTGDASLLPVFFGHGRNDWDGARAKRICGRCPVRAECLEYALTHVDTTGSEFTPTKHDAGVWGGLTAAERAALRRSDHDAVAHG